MMRLAAWLRRLRSSREDRPIEALLEEPGFVAIDLETTGLDVRRDAVVALAAIPFAAGRPGPGYVTLVDPARPIPVAATRIHGIDDARVAGAPSLDIALTQFDAICAGHVLVGHDVAFDLAMLTRARRIRQLPQPAIVAFDTRRLAIALHPPWRRPGTLEAIAADLGIPVVGRHTADGDARLAGEILVALLPDFRRRGVETLGGLTWAQTALYRRA